MFSKTKVNKFIAIGMIVTFSFVLSAPVISGNAASGASPVPNLSISDLGTHMFFDFSNVTFTTDGTGSDYGSSPTTLLTKLNFFPVGNLQSVSDVRFSVGHEGLFSDSVNVGNVNFKTSVTNQTANELFDFDVLKQIDLGKFDFGESITTATEYNTTQVNAAAVAINVTSDYTGLNLTLTTLASKHTVESGSFDGVHNRVSRGNYDTILAGYENIKVGIMSDLKSWLSFFLGHDIDDIRIQEVVLTSAFVTFNTSQTMSDYIKTAFDTTIQQLHDDDLDANDITLKLAIPSGHADLGLTARGILGGVERSVNSMAIKFGVPLLSFKKSTAQLFSGIATGSNGDAASTYYNPAGSVFKNALSFDPSTNKAQIDVSDKVGTGTNNLVTEAIAVAGTFLVEVESIVSANVGWILLGGFAILVIYYLYRRRSGKGLI